ncbi:GL15348 [Drosophila persimilis]|uniref:GL15348 n=1 Tax=Drosophila persimilis TaxID=7234 RepID=B4HD44_DROPE|nr:GL15348 [Drosophila persimilis]
MATARRGTTPGGTATPAPEAVEQPTTHGSLVCAGTGYDVSRGVPATSTSKTLNLGFEIK